MIYFIEQDGMVKIGFTKNPSKRLSALQSSNPNELIVRLVIDGTLEDETKYHMQFKDRHIRGEWFLLDEDMLKFIEKNEKQDLRYELGLIYNTEDIKIETARIRNVFNLNLREMGEILGITPQSVNEIELRERAGSLTLNALRKYGKVLGYRLVYKFVKEDS
jgi:DNA-binding XRE family transcriptional regulator